MSQDCTSTNPASAHLACPFPTFISLGIPKLFMRWDRVPEDLAVRFFFVAERRHI